MILDSQSSYGALRRQNNFDGVISGRVYSLLLNYMHMKSLACADMGLKECNFVAKGENNDEVMAAMREHAEAAHPAMLDKMEQMMESKIKM